MKKKRKKFREASYDEYLGPKSASTEGHALFLMVGKVTHERMLRLVPEFKNFHMNRGSVGFQPVSICDLLSDQAGRPGGHRGESRRVKVCDGSFSAWW